MFGPKRKFNDILFPVCIFLFPLPLSIPNQVVVGRKQATSIYSLEWIKSPDDNIPFSRLE